MNDWYVPGEPTIEDRLKAIEARLEAIESLQRIWKPIVGYPCDGKEIKNER